MSNQSGQVENQPGKSNEQRPNIESFARYLKLVREARAIDLGDLSNTTGITLSKLTSWERGDLKHGAPTLASLHAIAAGLKLSEQEHKRLVDLLLDGILRRPTQVHMHELDTSTIETILAGAIEFRETEAPVLRQQVGRLQGAVDALVQSVEELKIRSSDPTLEEGVRGVSAAADEVLAISDALTAPISVPNRERMRVQLVPLADVDRISEYRNEQNTWNSVAGVFVGVALGIVVNVVTGGYMTAFAWAVIVTAILLAALTGWTAWRYGQRARQLRNSYLQSFTL